MSLYDGLDMDDKGSGGKESRVDVSGWGSSLKLMETQKQIQAKKASLLNVKRRSGGSVKLPPVVNLNRKPVKAPQAMEEGMRFNHQTGRLEKPVTSSVPSGPQFIANEAPTAFPGITDEYDPLRPNEYEEVVQRKREQRREERKREQEERRRREKASDSDSDDEFEKRRRRRAMEDESEEDRPRSSASNRTGAAIAPPAALLEESTPSLPIDEGPPVPGKAPGASFGLGGSVASKIMMKMGYRDGQGLGKSEQGMSTALQVEKTSKRGGKIIHEKDIPKVPEPPRTEQSNANLLKNPSKVLLLQNMVGPGEVDEELEPETAEECQKYGKVNKCLIFEMPDVADDMAVRIFVEFERMESAIKAVVDLNGRFFGGRVVQAGFYNLDKFRRLDLAGPPE